MLRRKARRKSNLFILLRITLTATILLYVLTQSGFEELKDTITSDIRIEFWLTALMLFQFGVVLRTIRWRILLREIGVDEPFSVLVNLNYGAAFFSTFLPTGIGGDVIRATGIKHDDKTITELAGIVVLDRLIGLVTLFFICMVALPFGIASLSPITSKLAALVSIVGLGASFVIVESRLLDWVLSVFQNYNLPGTRTVERIHHTMKTISHRAIWKTIGVSLIYNCLMVISHFLIGQAFQAEVSLRYFAVFTPLVALSLLVPVIQGIGIREEMYRNLLMEVGVPSVVGVSVGLGVYSINLATGLFGSLIYIIYTLRERKTLSIPSEIGPDTLSMRKML